MNSSARSRGESPGLWYIHLALHAGTMKTSPAGFALIQDNEGFKRFATPDAKGKMSIGYGHDLLPGESYPNGIEQPEGAELLVTDVGYAEHAVDTLVLTSVSIHQEQYDSLVDWIYNDGTEAFATSTLLRLLKAGRFTEAAYEMHSWCHAGLKVIRGLLKRRCTEVVLFLTNCPPDKA